MKELAATAKEDEEPLEEIQVDRPLFTEKEKEELIRKQKKKERKEGGREGVERVKGLYR